MLSLLQQAAHDNCRRRRTWRRAALIVPAIALLAGVGLWWMPRGPARNDVAGTVTETPPVNAVNPVNSVGTGEEPPRPSVAQDNRASGIPVDRLDDDQLLEMLHAIGRPAGLARINGRVELVAMDNPPAGRP